MIADPVAEPVPMRELVINRIEFSREREVDLDDAITEAVAFIQREGLVNALFEEVGCSLLRDIWTTHQRARRKAALNAAALTMQPGESRHNYSSMSNPDSLYETLYSVAGEWKRLGDLLVSDVEALEQEYRSRIAENSKYAEFFHALGQKLKRNKNVRESLSEAELRLLFEKA